MTEPQRRFATKNHNLIYRFLRDRGWDIREYYDIAAFGFLRAVQRYFLESKLTRYAFSTVAWSAMNQSVASFLRAETRRKDAEQRYVQKNASVASDPFAEMEARLMLHDLAAVSDQKQYELAEMRLQGYAIKEIAAKRGMGEVRVRRLLRELYRTYLQLFRT